MKIISFFMIMLLLMSFVSAAEVVIQDLGSFNTSNLTDDDINDLIEIASENGVDVQLAGNASQTTTSQDATTTQDGSTTLDATTTLIVTSTVSTTTLGRANIRPVKAKIRNSNNQQRIVSAIKHNSDLLEKYPTLARRLNNLDSNNPGVVDALKSLDADQKTKFVKLTRAKQAEIVKMDPEDIEDELENYEFKKVNLQNLYKKRAIAKDRLEQAKTKYQNAKENYVKANNMYRERKQTFMDYKNELEECTGSTSEECEEFREKIQNNAMEYVVKSADMAINHLEKILYKVEGSEELEEEMVDDMSEKINSAIANLEDAKEKAKEAETKEEIQEAAKMVSEEWKQIRYHERVYATKLINGKIWSIITRAENVEEKLDAALDNLEEQGIDVSEIETLVEDYSEKVAEAKDLYEQAKEKAKEAMDIVSQGNLTDEQKDEVKTLIADGKKLVKDSETKLREAYRILMDILRKIRDSGTDLNSLISDVASEQIRLVEVE